MMDNLSQPVPKDIGMNIGLVVARNGILLLVRKVKNIYLLKIAKLKLFVSTMEKLTLFHKK
jgi:hypothetical protein